ncbi:MAG: radical SAM protein [Nanoarchaeota archaeon]
MVNIKLIRAPCNEPLKFHSTRLQTHYFPPLALGTITAYLRSKGINVDQDDLNIKLKYDNYYSRNKIDTSIFFNRKRITNYILNNKDDYLEELCKNIVNKTKIKNINAILLSGDSGYEGFLYTAAISNFLKKKYDVPIIIGGVNLRIGEYEHAYRLVSKNKVADFLINGNGEIPSYKIISQLDGEVGVKDVPGLIYMKGGKVRINKPAKCVLIKPDFTGLPLNKYRWIIGREFKHELINPEKKELLILPFRFITGCPHHCAYCGSSMDNKIEFLSPTDVVKYLIELSEEYNTPYFYFLHNTINISKPYINELCDKIIEKGLKIYWTDCATIKNMDKKILIKMRKAGCISLWFGAETGSQKLLDYIEKGITIEQISHVLRWSHEAGIWTCVEIISGLPTETDYDIRQTTAFLKENSKFIDTINFSPFFLCYPSRMYVYPKKYGIKNIRLPKNDKNRVNVIYLFDEINGFKWKNKEKQIYFSNKKTRYNSPRKGEILNFDHTPILFTLYSQFTDKGTIKKIYKKINRRLYFYLLIKPKTLSRYIMDIKTVSEIKHKILCLIKGLD